jgi:hypothetical protein
LDDPAINTHHFLVNPLPRTIAHISSASIPIATTKSSSAHIVPYFLNVIR